MLLAASHVLFYIPWRRAGVHSSRMDRVLNTVFLKTAFTEDERWFLLPSVQGGAELVSALEQNAGSAETWPATSYARALEQYYMGITVSNADWSTATDKNKKDKPRSQYVRPVIRVAPYRHGQHEEPCTAQPDSSEGTFS